MHYGYMRYVFTDDHSVHGKWTFHYSDFIMGAMVSRITSLTIVYSTVYSGANERKHQSSASLAIVRGVHRWPDKGPVTRKMFPFDDVIMSFIFVATSTKSALIMAYIK